MDVYAATGLTPLIMLLATQGGPPGPRPTPASGLCFSCDVQPDQVGPARTRTAALQRVFGELGMPGDPFLYS